MPSKLFERLVQDWKDLNFECLPQKPSKEFGLHATMLVSRYTGHESWRRFPGGAWTNFQCPNNKLMRLMGMAMWEAGMVFSPENLLEFVGKNDPCDFYSNFWGQKMRRIPFGQVFEDRTSSEGACILYAEGPLKGEEVCRAEVVGGSELRVEFHPATVYGSTIQEPVRWSLTDRRISLTSKDESWIYAKKGDEWEAVEWRENGTSYQQRPIAEGPSRYTNDVVRSFLEEGTFVWIDQGEVVRQVAIDREEPFEDGWRVLPGKGSLLERACAMAKDWLEANPGRSWLFKHKSVALDLTAWGSNRTLVISDREGNRLETQEGWFDDEGQLTSWILHFEMKHFLGFSPEGGLKRCNSISQSFKAGEVSVQFLNLGMEEYEEVKRFIPEEGQPSYMLSKKGLFPQTKWPHHPQLALQKLEFLQKWVSDKLLVMNESIARRTAKRQCAWSLTMLLCERKGLSPEQNRLLDKCVTPEGFRWGGVVYDPVSWEVRPNMALKEQPPTTSWVVGGALNVAVHNLLSRVPPKVRPILQFACLATLHKLSEGSLQAACATATELFLQGQLEAVKDGIPLLLDQKVLAPFAQKELALPEA